MLITTCIPCQHGRHDECVGVIEAPPPGMIGGSKCGCEGECQPRTGGRSVPMTRDSFTVLRCTECGTDHGALSSACEGGGFVPEEAVFLDDVVEDLRASADALAEALEQAIAAHHDTITPSRLHDPHHIESPRECPALTCKAAYAALAAYRTRTEGSEQ